MAYFYSNTRPANADERPDFILVSNGIETRYWTPADDETIVLTNPASTKTTIVITAPDAGKMTIFEDSSKHLEIVTTTEALKAYHNHPGREALIKDDKSA